MEEYKLNFIKWMADNTKEFSYTHEIFYYTFNDNWSQGRFIEAIETWEHWSILLQKAIEGINQSQDKYSIQLDSHNKWNRISIYNNETDTIVLAEGFNTSENGIKAKIAALKYIKEHSDETLPT